MSSAVQDILNRLRAPKALCDELSKQLLGLYLINGKSMSEWKNHFYVKIPPDLNPVTVREVDMKLMELYQEASFLKIAAHIRLTSMNGSTHTAFREQFNKIVSEYKDKGNRIPSKETITTLAEESISNEKDAIVHAEIELNFWKEILNHLQECRKLIENATINLASEAKALYNERYFDSLDKKSNY